MSTKHPLHGERRVCAEPLAALKPHLAAFESYLRERRHAASYIAVCKRCVAHLSLWMKQTHRGLGEFNEALVDTFVDDHLARWTCGNSSRTRAIAHAALGHGGNRTTE